MSQSQTSISVSRTDAAFFVRIDGAATMTLSPAFAALCERCREQFDHPIFVDLSACEQIDSTFAGCLVGQSIKANQADGNGLALVCPHARCLDALVRMGLDRLLRIEAVEPPSPETFTAVESQMCTAEHISDAVIDAHERLAATSEANARVFGPIAAAFRADRQRHRRTDA